MSRFQVYAAVLTVIMVIWAVVAGAMPSVSARMRVVEDFKGIPMEIDDWSGENVRFGNEKSLYEQLPTCSLLSRPYVDSSNNIVSLDIVLGRDLGDFHQPEICMTGAGWRVMSKQRITLTPKNGLKHEAMLLRLNGTERDIMLIYWFYMDGRPSPTMNSKLRSLTKGMFSGLPPSAMIKYTAPILVDEKTAANKAREVAELLDEYVIATAAKTPVYEPYDKIIKEMSEEE